MSDPTLDEAQYAAYDAFVEKTQKWLGTRADRYHVYHNTSRILLVVLSVSIPTLSQGTFGASAQGLQGLVALAIALLAALDGLLKPGDNWRHFRSYQLALQRAKRVLKSKCASLELEEDPTKRRQKRLALHRDFVSEVEEVLEQESKIYFEHQARRTPPQPQT